MEKKKSSKLAKGLWAFAGFGAGIMVGASMTVARVADMAGLKDVFMNVMQAAVLVQDAYIEPVNAEKFRDNLISGLVDQLDPHSMYLPAPKYKEMKQGMSGSYGGIGITAKPGEDKITVSEVQPGGPADKAGLKKGDVIEKVEGEAVKGKKLDEVFDKIRGPMDSKVKLSVLRNGKPISVSVGRAAIKVPTVQYGYVEEGGSRILALRVKSFGETTVSEASAILREAFGGKLGAKPTGLIMDLRGNPGGILQSAVGLSALFIAPDLPVVISRERDAANERVYKARAADWKMSMELPLGSESPIEDLKAAHPELETLPMAVLVNRESASAAEIVAGALKDHKRAQIVGSKTFGKGSVQSVFALGDGQGAIKLTTSRYYTPANKPIQAVGVEPDVQVADKGRGYREADLPKHLKSETGTESKSDMEAMKKEAEAEACLAKDKDKAADEEGESTFSKTLTKLSAKDEHVKAALSVLVRKGPEQTAGGSAAVPKGKG